ncbi:MAG: hypothetical protein QGG39_07290 [Candidatus Poribacteria bacterium]|nr:hypothetical protein [Candidatus Poribacteria bacterium]
MTIRNKLELTNTSWREGQNLFKQRLGFFPVLPLYAILLAVVLWKHEPWADEAQAWLIARDCSGVELLFQRLRYEGHPGLWYLILMVPSKILPYYPTIQVISFSIAVAGIFVFWRTSPFPPILKTLFPFTYFIFYQYAVVARSYVLLPLLIFLVGHYYPQRFRRVYLFTLLLCLLAYVSVFSALIAISTMLVHFLDLLKWWKELEGEERKRQMASLVAFGLFMILMAFQLWQPTDSSFAKNYHFELDRVTSRFLEVTDLIMVEIKPISYSILAVSCVWFWINRVLLLYLLSSLSIIFLFAVKYFNSWHEGILFLAWILPLWISFQSQSKDNVRGGEVMFSRYKRAMTLMASLVFAFHIYWAGAASISDLRGSYSAGRATADYIKTHQMSEAKIYATTFWSTSILAFFDQNIFLNHNNGQRPSFWFWANDNRHDDNLNWILEQQPDLVIIGRPKEPLASIDGYQLVNLFEGNLYWKNRIKERQHFAIYRKLSSVD